MHLVCTLLIFASAQTPATSTIQEIFGASLGAAYDWTKKSLDGTTTFFTFGHCGALVPSLAANGLIVNSLYPSAEESWEEMIKIEPRNKMLYSHGSDQ